MNHLRPFRLAVIALGLAALSGMAPAQSAQDAPASVPAASATLEREFFAAIREGDWRKVLSYTPEQGLQAGARPEHLSRDQVEQQFLHHRGLYCKLFDSSCIDAPIKLDAGVRTCSYRELLTHSEKVRTASTETTRNGVRQAILVAEVTNQQCAGPGLIDFIFNYEHGRWTLFSVP